MSVVTNFSARILAENGRRENENPVEGRKEGKKLKKILAPNVLWAFDSNTERNGKWRLRSLKPATVVGKKRHSFMFSYFSTVIVGVRANVF